MRIEKPWGWYEVVSQQPNATVKILCINPGHRLSNQYHQNRMEYLVAFNGYGGVDVGVDPNPQAAVARHLLFPGEAVLVQPKHVHRIYCSEDSDGPLMLTEVWIGEHLDENDIVRLEDDYGRS